MISWSDVNSLRKEKIKLQLQLESMLNSGVTSRDEINALKSEILHLTKQIEKIVGSNEIKRQKEIRKRKSGVEQRQIKNYLAFKARYKKISNMSLAVNRMLSCIERQNTNYKDSQNANYREPQIVKVR